MKSDYCVYVVGKQPVPWLPKFVSKHDTQSKAIAECNRLNNEDPVGVYFLKQETKNGKD